MQASTWIRSLPTLLHLLGCAPGAGFTHKPLHSPKFYLSRAASLSVASLALGASPRRYVVAFGTESWDDSSPSLE